MSTQDTAKSIVAMLKDQRFAECGETYFADDVVSIEAMGPPGMDLTIRGKAAVLGKGKWFADNHEIHGVSADGPYVNGDQFATRLTMDMTFKVTGEKHHMEEIAVYTLKDDKIVEERFLFGAM